MGPSVLHDPVSQVLLMHLRGRVWLHRQRGEQSYNNLKNLPNKQTEDIGSKKTLELKSTDLVVTTTGLGEAQDDLEVQTTGSEEEEVAGSEYQASITENSPCHQ